jgi:carbamoyl-phosphate synthase large subunit
MQKTHQVLILSANAKVPLIRAFQTVGAVVHAADISAMRAGLILADRQVVLPKTTSPAFTDALLSYCREQQIDLIVPTRDGDLLPLSKVQQGLNKGGTVCLISTARTIETCLDKIKFVGFCQQNNLPAADRYRPDMAGKLFIRPRLGAGGEAAYAVSNSEDPMFRDEGNWLAQEYVDAPEYSIDLLSDLAGTPLQAVARRRALTRGGEAQISVVEDQPALVALALKIGASLNLVGHNVIQAFLHPERGPLLIEANARFGGASALSIEAGLNSPARIIANLSGPADPGENNNIRFGLTLLRYPSDLYVMAEELGDDR